MKTLDKSLKKQFETQYPGNSMMMFFDIDRDLRKKEKNNARERASKEMKKLEFLAAEERFNRFNGANNNSMERQFRKERMRNTGRKPVRVKIE